MKKFFLWLFAIIILVLILLCGLLFTPIGNGILKPYIQKQIDKYSPVPVSLNVFELGFSSFRFELNAMTNIDISSNGTFSLFNQSIDGMLNINIKSPSNIKELEGINLGDNFLIENVVRGDINNLTINTRSSLADGNLKIDTEIKDFVLSNIVADINNLRVESLLNVVGQKPYASGILNAKANINGDSNMNFTGSLIAKVADGAISKSLVKKDFGLDVPNTSFSINLDSKFNGKDIDHRLDFISNIGNINSIGKTAIETLRTDSTYDINIKDLSPLTPIAGMPLKGSLRTNGKVIGNSIWLNIDGVTDFASSKTTYTISLENFTKPKDALITIENLKVEEVLKTLLKPVYANGILNAKIDLKNISSSINGTYSHDISGSLQKGVMKQEFDFNMNSNLAFKHDANIIFTNGIGNVNAKASIDSANIEIEKAVLNTDNMSLEAPYSINISDLKKLAFITGKELKGNLNATGRVKYADSNLYADIKSDILGGSFDAKLDKNIINANLSNINSLDLLDMLQYPKIFETDMSGNIKYDIMTQKGNLDFIASGGHFSQNKLMNLISSILKFDGTKEMYNDIKISGDINKKLVSANLDMTSGNTTLSAKKAQLDIDKNTINTYLLLKIKNNELGATIKGDINNPNISLDTTKLAKDVIKGVMQNEKVQEQKQKLEQKLEEQKDKLGEKLNNAIGSGLNKLFKK